jgi:hypothetical protein
MGIDGKNRSKLTWINKLQIPSASGHETGLREAWVGWLRENKSATLASSATLLGKLKIWPAWMDGSSAHSSFQWQGAFPAPLYSTSRWAFGHLKS